MLFIERQRAVDELWPWHWPPPLRDASILIFKPSALLEGPRGNLLAWLRAIPTSRVRQMQRTLAAHVVRMTYLADRGRSERRRGSSDEGYDEDDAMDIMLRGLAGQFEGRDPEVVV